MSKNSTKSKSSSLGKVRAWFTPAVITSSLVSLAAVGQLGVARVKLAEEKQAREAQEAMMVRHTTEEKEQREATKAEIVKTIAVIDKALQEAEDSRKTYIAEAQQLQLSAARAREKVQPTTAAMRVERSKLAYSFADKKAQLMQLLLQKKVELQGRL